MHTNGHRTDEWETYIAIESVAEEEPEEEGFGTRMKAAALELLETLALAAVIWLVVNAATARYVVEGVSMQPTLHTGQFLSVSRLDYLVTQPQRGDVIVFDYPNNPTDDYVKRIIGLPGDTVRIDVDGTVFINDEPLQEPYAQTYGSRGGPWQVPEGTYFVMGDNRGQSSDSRSWGVVEEDLIIGKAWVSYWPPQDWGLAPHYHDYDGK